MDGREYLRLPRDGTMYGSPLQVGDYVWISNDCLYSLTALSNNSDTYIRQADG
jgi:hypothetical protein